LDVVDAETKKPSIGHPSSGLFLYFNEAEPVLKRFLKTEGNAAGKIFKRPFKEILQDFDKTAEKLISPGCFGDGFANGATAAAFPAGTP
jgi:hypothetical protein